MAHVLIVEDQTPVARLLRRWVEAEGKQAVLATSAEQALLLAAQHAPAVALCDIHLPGGRDGFWFLEQLRVCHPATVAVMTTGQQAFDPAVAGLPAGVCDYVPKPYTRERLTGALNRALVEHTARRAALAARFGAPADATSSPDVQTTTTAALLSVLYADDEPVARQAHRVSRLAVTLADALGIAGAQVSDIEHAALLHYVRRLDIHSMARHVPVLAAASEMAVAVEERFNGNGFPLGLAGQAIPLGARVIAVAAAYDELTAGRAQGEGAAERAVATLCDERAAEFDPAVLEALKRMDAELQATAA